MSLYFATVTFKKPASNYKVELPEALNTANVALQGFRLSYGSDTDTYVETIEVEISNINAQRGSKSITFDVDMEMTSTGQSASDLFVQALVIADLQGAAAFEPAAYVWD